MVQAKEQYHFVYMAAAELSKRALGMKPHVPAKPNHVRILCRTLRTLPDITSILVAYYLLGYFQYINGILLVRIFYITLEYYQCNSTCMNIVPDITSILMAYHL